MSTFVHVGRLSFLRVYRRKFSTTLRRCGQLHSGFLALPAASSEALDHGRLSEALRLIKGKGRLYVGLVGSYEFPSSKFNKPPLDPLKSTEGRPEGRRPLSVETTGGHRTHLIPLLSFQHSSDPAEVRFTEKFSCDAGLLTPVLARTLHTRTGTGGASGRAPPAPRE